MASNPKSSAQSTSSPTAKSVGAPKKPAARKKRAVNGVSWEQLRALLLGLPGVEEGTSWGTAAYRANKKLLGRMHDDGETFVLKCADREMLMAANPQAFFVTKHYENYPWVLVRLNAVTHAELQAVTEEAWRSVATAKQLKQYDSGTYVAPPLAPAQVAPPQPKPKADEDAQLARVRALCLCLPESEEKISWGTPVFRLKGGKQFAMYAYRHHGDARIALWLHAPTGMQALLVEAAPAKFFIPPYVGKSGWIGVDLTQVDDAELALHIRQAYCVIAPKKLQDKLA